MDLRLGLLGQWGGFLDFLSRSFAVGLLRLQSSSQWCGCLEPLCFQIGCLVTQRRATFRVYSRQLVSSLFVIP